MSVKIPSHFDFGIDLGLDLSGIPTNYSFGITNIPKINLGIDPIALKIDPLQIKIDPLEIKPLDLSFRIKEIPSVRVHFPVDYKVGVALFGAELASVRLCGQAQVITEPYVPNPCECRAVPDRGGVVDVGRPVSQPVRPVG
jgi:hypothetical protein